MKREKSLFDAPKSAGGGLFGNLGDSKGGLFKPVATTSEAKKSEPEKETSTFAPPPM